MIVFYKLGDYLKANNMKYIDLQKETGLSPTIIAKFQKNRSVTVDTIDKVCTFLKVQPGDIMEWVEDESALQEKEIQAQMESLKKQLEEIQAKKRNGA
jgi:DNA-binding Xre family transcriptional regulator